MKKAWVLALVLLLTAGVSRAWALTVLKGQDASKHVGDAKAKFVGSDYTYEILKRSHRDSMHGRFSDAVIFNPGGGNFNYPRRKDGDHRLVLDDPAGRAENAVTEEAWKDLDNVLSDDNSQPTVFLDEQGKELAVVFTGRGTNLKSKMNENGLLELEIAVDGAGKQVRGRRRGMM
jgi:hypothetical protein